MGHNTSSNIAEVRPHSISLPLSSRDASDSNGDSVHIDNTSQLAHDFPRFLELPSELQIAVFREAILSCHDTHELANLQFLFLEPTWTGRSPSILRSPYRNKAVYGHSFVREDRKDLYRLMRTCRLSRQLVLEWWLESMQRSRKPYSKEKIEVKARMAEVLGELLRQMKG